MLCVARMVDVSTPSPASSVRVDFYTGVSFVRKVRLRHEWHLLTRDSLSSNCYGHFRRDAFSTFDSLPSSLVSKQGYQILIGIVLVAVLYGLSLKPVRWVTMGLIHLISK